MPLWTEPVDVHRAGVKLRDVLARDDPPIDDSAREDGIVAADELLPDRGPNPVGGHGRVRPNGRAAGQTHVDAIVVLHYRDHARAEAQRFPAGSASKSARCKSGRKKSSSGAPKNSSAAAPSSACSSRDPSSQRSRSTASGRTPISRKSGQQTELVDQPNGIRAELKRRADLGQRRAPARTPPPRRLSASRRQRGGEPADASADDRDLHAASTRRWSWK